MRFVLPSLALFLLAAPAASQDAPADPEKAQAEESVGHVIERVRGSDDLGEPELTDEVWVWRDLAIGGPLPVGYPRPTPPGAVEIKLYPVVRRAETTSNGSRTGPFWKLFQHIQTREIAMTTPVEMDYAEREDDGNWGDMGREQMSFLYRTRDLGPVGEAEPGVMVVDTPEVVVLAMGFRGDTGPNGLPAAFEELDRIAATLDGWTVGTRRRGFVYNGPERQGQRRWSEAHIELVRVTEGTEPAPRGEMQ